jgi:DNA-binding CsgD family transcriptional regulator
MTHPAAIQVRAADVRRLLHLAGELREIRDQNARLQHAVTGISGLTGADVGAIFVFDSPLPVVPRTGVIHGYDPTQTQAVLAQYATHGVDFDLMAVRLREQFDGTGQIVRRRRELLENRAWYGSLFLNEGRRQWGVDDCVYSLQGLGGASFGLGLNRAFGSTPFSEAERCLVEMFNVAVAGTARECLLPWVPSELHSLRGALPPRTRQILDHLLRGESNKDIAEQLGISPNTVHHHCKLVFRAFGVMSRSEFIARWFAGR